MKKSKKCMILCIMVLFMTSAVLTAQTLQWYWVKQAGGSGDDYGYSISVDANGNSYITGYFKGTATFGAFTLTSSGWYDVFVAKLDADGNWQWAKQAVGSAYDEGYGISIDANGNSYVTGCFYQTATFGAFTLTSSGDKDVFVAKLDTDGNWQWAKQAGGSSIDYGRGISVDANGNSYVTGLFSGTATFGADILTSSGGYDVFVAKLDTVGNWQWAKQAGGWSHDHGYSISVDANGNSYVTGKFKETATFGAFTLTSNGYADVFVAKLTESGIAVDFNPDGYNDFDKNILTNYPNPFSGSTTIEYGIKGRLKAEPVEIRIYNVAGQLIETIEARYGTSKLNVDNLPTGVYFYQLKTENYNEVKKMLLLR